MNVYKDTWPRRTCCIKQVLKIWKIVFVILHIQSTYKIIFLERPVVKPNKK